MRYILYARKSSEGDERQVQSIPDQHAVLERLADSNGFTIVGSIDEAHSAKQPGTRPGFERMLDALKRGDADGILCWHLNRLSRNPVDSGTLSWMLQQGEIKVIRTADREYLPDDNVVVMAVENAVANQFIVDLKRNVRRGQREKALRGWFPHKPPPGYRTDPESKEIIPDGERFELIRRAWDMMLTGAYSVPEVQTLLAEWGFQNRWSRKPGRSLNRTGLYNLFDNPFYYGEFHYSGQPYKGKHQPMVSFEEFQQVQRIIHKSEPFSPRRPEFAFTGLIRCGACGCLITAEQKIKTYPKTKRTVEYVYYRCTRSKGCSEKAVTGAYVEQEFADLLRSVSIGKDLGKWLNASANEFQPDESERIEQRFKELQLELDDCEQRRARLLELRIADEISAEEFAELNRNTKGAIDKLSASIDRLRLATTRYSTTIHNIANFVEIALERFLQPNVKAKREIATCLTERATLVQGKLKIDVNPLLAWPLTLEPLKARDQQVQDDVLATLRPAWGSWLDGIRTLATEDERTFPRLECLSESASKSLPGEDSN